MHFIPLGADPTPPDGSAPSRPPQDIVVRGVKCIPRYRDSAAEKRRLFLRPSIHPELVTPRWKDQHQLHGILPAPLSGASPSGQRSSIAHRLPTIHSMITNRRRNEESWSGHLENMRNEVKKACSPGRESDPHLAGRNLGLAKMR